MWACCGVSGFLYDLSICLGRQENTDTVNTGGSCPELNQEMLDIRLTTYSPSKVMVYGSLVPDETIGYRNWEGNEIKPWTCQGKERIIRLQGESEHK